MARTLLAVMMAGVCYLDFFAYRAQGWADPAMLPKLTARLHGTADAPDQYRMGVLWLAQWMAVHLHVAMTMSLAVIDGACGMVAVMVLYQVLIRTEVYAEASAVERWFGSAVFVLLMLWWLLWLLWLQKPETLAAAGMVAGMVWLWQARRNATALTQSSGSLTQSFAKLTWSPHPSQKREEWGTRAVGLVGLSLVLATFRADVACLLNVGVLAYVVVRRESRLALRFPAAVVVSLTSAVIAGAMQVWLVRVAYPEAGYGLVKFWQLWPNVKHGTRWPPFAVFVLPLVWMGVQVWRRRFTGDAAGSVLLCGAMVYAVLWGAIGKIDEVRIFLPFALALGPLTVEMAILRVREHSLRG
jgi:hypothetical protein